MARNTTELSMLTTQNANETVIFENLLPDEDWTVAADGSNVLIDFEEDAQLLGLTSND